ncbi:MAG TPA: hypothetical protein HA252_07150 [Candidatus Diapherotrites archaeon]|uniref:Uncharacterized protein n=1 Tax=Candidatus Iainarchaeum sp. TaxID=3101447 RepID=A0A7J4JHB5_9ARCH|nr:hypothetical protein [Candidatus Diapherotrites archaeon]HIH17153.1 hypothetical protein [Candidatus Diapherotrites archaeon]
MTFEPVSDAEARRLVNALAQQFGEGMRGFFEGKVFFARGNHAWLATRECMELIRSCRGVNVQQPGLLALVDVKACTPSRELAGLLQAVSPGLGRFV